MNMAQPDGAPGRETYWGVRAKEGLNPFKELKVFFLLGYYDDAGQVNAPWPFNAGHKGDSEFIEIHVSFDTTFTHGGTQGRWLLTGATYSAHYNTSADRTTFYHFSNLEYITGSRDYPVVWVAKGKHANYSTRSLCSASGPFRWDDCSSNTAGSRVSVEANRNIGSSGRPLTDCVLSVEQPSLYHGEECLWTDSAFRGWYTDDVTDGVLGYGPILQDYGWHIEIQ